MGLVYLLVLFVVARGAWIEPTWEWDILGYAGCVEELKGANPEEIHAAVYGELAQHAPPEVAADLRGKIAYRSQLSSNAAAFNAQLPFYRGRLFYLGLLAGLDAVGMTVMRGAFVLSLLAGVAFALILGLWCFRYLPTSLGYLAVAAGFMLTGARQVMTMATPDMLAATLLLGGAFLLLEKQRRLAGVLLLGLAIATRADHLILVVPLLVWDTFRPRESGRGLSKAQLAEALIVCAGLFWVCTAGRSTYSWWTVYQHTFVEYMTFPANQTPPADYASAIERSLRSLPMFKAAQPLAFGLIALFALVAGWRRERFASFPAGLAAVSLAGLLAHFTLFPALWPRLMLVYWTLALIALCATLGRGTPQPRSDQASP